MALVEFQISVPAFLAAQLTNLRTQEFCPPQPFSIGDYQLVIDHFELTENNSIRHNVQTGKSVAFQDPLYGDRYALQDVKALQTQLAQEVVAFIADYTEVISHPNQTPRLVSASATIVLNLNYNVYSLNICNFEIGFDHLELGQLPPLPPGIDPERLRQEFENQVQKLVPYQSKLFNIATVISPSIRVMNAGLSVDSDFQHLAFRAETNATSYSPQVWESFYSGYVPDRLQGEDWSFFIDRKLLEWQYTAMVDNALSQSQQDAFQLVTGVGSSYSNAGGKAHITTSFAGNIDAKICTAWTEITINSDILVQTPNTLTIDTTLAWDAATGFCKLAAGLIGSVLGAVVDLIAPFLIPIINPVTGFWAGVATATYLENNFSPDLKPGDCQKLSDSHYVCTRQLKLNSASTLGKLRFKNLVPLDDGILLSGELKAVPPTIATLQSLHTSNFAWLPPVISCGQISGQERANFLSNPTRYVSLGAVVSIDKQGTAPLYLCDYSIMNDPQGVFQRSLFEVTEEEAPLQIKIFVPYPGEQYYQAPYPFQLLIRTTGGIRLISIPAPPPLTQQDIERLLKVLEAQVAACNVLIDDWFTHFYQYNPAWSVDPGPESTVEHYWEVEVTGLAAGEPASLVDRAGQTIMTATTPAGRSLVMSALLAPAGQGELGIVRETGAKTFEVTDELISQGMNLALQRNHHRGIAVLERLMLHTATIALNRPCRGIGAAYLQGIPSLLVIFEDTVDAYDVSVPSLPVLTYSWFIPGLRGVLPWQGNLLGFGDKGFVRIEPERTELHHPCGIQWIKDAILGQGVIAALGQEGLEIYSRRFHRLACLPIEAGHQLARVRSLLVVAESAGLSIFDCSNPQQPVFKYRHHLPHVTKLVTPPNGNGPVLLAVIRDGISRLLDFSHSNRIDEIAVYQQTPWFLNSAQLANLLLKLSADHTSISVNRFGESKML